MITIFLIISVSDSLFSVFAQTNLIGQTNSTLNETSDIEWKVYKNPILGFEVKYPSDWILEEGNNGISTHPITKQLTDKEGHILEPHPIFKLFFDNSQKIESLDKFTRERVNYYQVLNGFKISQLNSTNLGPYPGNKIVFTWTPTNDNVLRKTMEIDAIIENYPYIVTFDSFESTYAKYLPIVEKMLDSFKIIPLTG